DWLVVTLPHYAEVAKRVGMRTAYYSHDPFQFYAWWSDTVREWEDWLLGNCELVTAVSQQQVEDFRARTRGRLEWSPNATSREFLEEVRRARVRKPPELAAIETQIVGCVGQISASYDLDLIEQLARRFEDVAFVFVGQVSESDESQRARIVHVLSLPNVHWLGARPHAELPRYLAHFDVCLNPLRAGAHADRRSPLRLYDYLTTDRPILSTPVREAEGHVPHVRVLRNVDDAAAALRSMLRTGSAQDAESRREYISRNTWSVRALEYLRSLGWQEVRGAASGSSGRS
ncbi:MAG TPA: glycosyltransferase, partial [Gemmatimonadaceae bacterium]|nr:glycosyltransferase [Gemmatimonadaceae bacterium]